jgi:LPS-assembly lipoprotein
MWWSKENLLRLVMRRCARPRNPHVSIHTFRFLGLARLASPALATIFRRLFATTVVTTILASCGFALRGSYELPYTTIQVTSRSNSVVAGLVRRDLADSKTKVVGNAKDAEAALTIIEERRDRQILSLSGAGRVREYELRMKVTYQFVDAKGQVIIPTSEILLKRTFAYDDTRVIAKQQEEAMLYQDMERDATGQILRRMIAVKKTL